MQKKKVILRAPLLTNSGYGIHSRQLFDWLYNRADVDLTVECLQWGNTSWILDGEEENGMINKIMTCSKPINQDFDISFQVQLPDEWKNDLAKKNIGVTALVETDRCSQEWVAKCNQRDEIIVPSTFTKNVLKRSGITMKPVTVIPEWYNNQILNRSLMAKTLNDSRFDAIKKPFNILVVGTLTSQKPEDDRKNLVNTIKWITEEFSDNDDVGIVLKTSFGKGSTADKQLCKEYLRKLKSDLGLSKDSHMLNLLHGNMSAVEIASLYHHKNIKMYASATRGEGYGLPLIEAAVAGLPIVATGWSGHLEFLNKQLFNPVDYELVQIEKSRVDGRIFVEGVKWANVVESSFKEQIRKVYEDYRTSKDNANKLMKEVRVNFSAFNIKEKYNRLFEEYFEK